MLVVNTLMDDDLLVSTSWLLLPRYQWPCTETSSEPDFSMGVIYYEFCNIDDTTSSYLDVDYSRTATGYDGNP